MDVAEKRIYQLAGHRTDQVPEQTIALRAGGRKLGAVRRLVEGTGNGPIIDLHGYQAREDWCRFFMMFDADVAAAEPGERLLEFQQRRKPEPSNQGTGFAQSQTSREHWHCFASAPEPGSETARTPFISTRPLPFCRFCLSAASV